MPIIGASRNIADARDYFASGSGASHVAPVPFTVEVRVDLGHNRFSHSPPWAVVGDLAGGVTAGTASVVLGVLWALGVQSPLATRENAEALMDHAHAG